MRGVQRGSEKPAADAHIRRGRGVSCTSGDGSCVREVPLDLSLATRALYILEDQVRTPACEGHKGSHQRVQHERKRRHRQRPGHPRTAGQDSTVLTCVSTCWPLPAAATSCGREATPPASSSGRPPACPSSRRAPTAARGTPDWSTPSAQRRVPFHHPAPDAPRCSPSLAAGSSAALGPSAALPPRR